MENPRILRLKDIEPQPLTGTKNKDGGWVKGITFPHNAFVKGTIFFRRQEVMPGHSPHRWHTHTIDRCEGYELIFPKDFVEVYHIISGKGVVQWRAKNGKIREEEVSDGDSIFFTVEMGEHQLLNNGTEKMFMITFGGPAPQRKNL
jgi:hypothetical protein